MILILEPPRVFARASCPQTTAQDARIRAADSRQCGQGKPEFDDGLPTPPKKRLRGPQSRGVRRLNCPDQGRPREGPCLIQACGGAAKTAVRSNAVWALLLAQAESKMLCRRSQLVVPRVTNRYRGRPRKGLASFGLAGDVAESMCTRTRYARILVPPRCACQEEFILNQ